MTNNNKKDSFIKFLKNERFIEWKLLPTDETSHYWETYLKCNPDEEEIFRLAEKHFDNINLSSYELSDNKKLYAIKLLEKSVEIHKQKRRIKIITYVAAACFAAFAFLLVYNKVTPTAPNESYIVGSELYSEDIQLIVGNQMRSFQENIEIEINKEGIAQVKTTSNADEGIEIERSSINKLIVPYGKQSSITLSDGSKVWLNSGSVLEFPSQFIGNKREIFLNSGELFVEVTSDSQKPFFVNTSQMSVKVYGTKFNISAYSDMPQSIVLVEGSVGIKSKSHKELILKPNQQAKLSSDDRFSIKEVDINEFVSWKSGYLIFNETPMTEVLRQIERYYNLSFNYDKDITLKGLTCDGRIILSDDLDNVMTTIALITSTEYKKIDNKIYFSNKPK